MIKMICAVLLALSLLTVLGAAQAWAKCGNTEVTCWGPHPDTKEHNVFAGKITVEACYSASDASCPPCAGMCSLQAVCNAAYPVTCKGKCWLWWHGNKTGATGWCRGDGTWRPPY